MAAHSPANFNTYDMKTYANFTENGVSQLGSDAWFRLDSRNTLPTQIADARKRMETLRFVKPHYNGFQILRGELNRDPMQVLFTS